MLSLVSVNIEGDRHLDRVLPFLAERAPDVVCVQELFEKDVPHFESAIGSGVFVPMTRHRPTLQGIGIFSVFLGRSQSFHYAGGSEDLVNFDTTSMEARHRTQRRVLLTAEITKDGVLFKIGTTHFTWTPDGEADEYQRADLAGLFTSLEHEDEIVFCGDFNAPRGKEIFSAIAARYHDNIPPHYTTSLDSALHRAGPLPYMVDGLFSTPGYAVTNVELVCDVSDHCAIVADIERV